MSVGVTTPTLRFTPKALGIPVVLTLVLVVLLILSVGIGSSWIAPGTVIEALFGAGERKHQIIVWTLRLPRALLSAEAGACLAVAGALLQVATRNALASPSVLGLVDGAALGVVTFLWVFSNEANALTVSVHYQPLAAILGALVCAFVVALLALKDGISPLRLILYGVTLAALANALVTILIVLGPVYRASTALIWLAGSVHAAHWQDVGVLALFMVAILPFLAASPRIMTQLALDETLAGASGLSVRWAQAFLLILAVVLTAGSVAQVGGIGFVGLIAPHAARRLVAGRGVRFLLTAALIGAAMVTGADIIARTALAPLQMPTGAVTALIGAPYFLYILMKASRHDI